MHIIKCALPLVLLPLLWANPARADRAVVVGVQKYANLPPAANRLQGCVNDAESIAALLTKVGFQVTLLTDAQATRQGILQALTKVRGSSGPQERFVFYFAGHGSDAPVRSLLPADASDTAQSADITRDDLYTAVSAIPARSRTILLDSCFSGGMSKSIGNIGRRTLRPRYYARQVAGILGAKGLVPANGQDSAAGSSPAAVCYYTAGMGNEQALEDDFGGKAHGVFTNFLLMHLAPSRAAAPVPWTQLHTAVKSDVAEYLGDQQHPTLSPDFMDTPVFESKSGAAPTPDPKPKVSTLWDDYNTDRVDASMVALTMDPNKTSVTLGGELRFRTRVGLDAYLVILERDVENQVYILFPKTRKAEDARVQPGQTINIPSDPSKVYQPDKAGTEHVKAILLTSPEKVSALLEAFPGSEGGVPLHGMKRLRERATTQAPFYTSELTFEVVAAGTP